MIFYVNKICRQWPACAATHVGQQSSSISSAQHLAKPPFGMKNKSFTQLSHGIHISFHTIPQQLVLVKKSLGQVVHQQLVPVKKSLGRVVLQQLVCMGKLNHHGEPSASGLLSCSGTKRLTGKFHRNGFLFPRKGLPQTRTKSLSTICRYHAGIMILLTKVDRFQ